jgi:anthranilate synthase component 2
LILIIDNYDSFTYNLVHLVAEHTDDYQVVRNDAITIEEIGALNPDGILISPGPGRPKDAGISCKIIEAFAENIPILGVCLGHQVIGEVYGGKVIHAPKLMHGKTSTINHNGSGVFEGIDDGFTATRYHSLVLDGDNIPDAFEITARSEDDVVMGIRHRNWALEGIQFHPESLLTKAGPKIIANWIARCREFNTNKEDLEPSSG